MVEAIGVAIAVGIGLVTGTRPLQAWPLVAQALRRWRVGYGFAAEANEGKLP